MATKIKYTQKELKGPDRFSSTVIAGFDYFADHSIKIVLVVAAVIVVLVAAYMVHNYRENKNDEATAMFNSAVEKLDTGDLQGAREEFVALRKEYPDKKISNIALYYSGIIDYKLGKYDDSINALNEFLTSGVDEDTLIQTAILTQGQARLEEGNWQQTVQFLGQFEKMPEGPIRDRALVNLAIAYEQMGQKAKADAVYKELYKKPAGLTSGTSQANVRPSSGKEDSK